MRRFKMQLLQKIGHLKRQIKTIRSGKYGVYKSGIDRRSALKISGKDPKLCLKKFLQKNEWLIQLYNIIFIYSVMLTYLSQKTYSPRPPTKRSFIEIIDDQEDWTQAELPRKKTSSGPVFIEIDKDEENLKAKKYSQIPECPTHYLTTQEMKSDPLPLFIELEKKYEAFGAVKMVASKDWAPKFSFCQNGKKITSRVQVLNELYEGKSFEQKIEKYTFSSFQALALQYSRDYKFLTKTTSNSHSEKLEQEFWNTVSNPIYKSLKTQVEYAADLPVTKYSSGFPTKDVSDSRDQFFDYSKNLFNLNNTYKSPESLLKIIDTNGQIISGVTSPWVYLGMQFSSFCWHVEDLYINSLNYNHMGAVKMWYIVPRSDKAKFDAFVQRKYAKILQHKPDLLHRITLMIDPLDLIKEGIKVYKVKQNQRSYVMTFAQVYHSGFSHGFNVGEAVNFANIHAIPSIRQALVEYQKFLGKKMAIFPIEWLIYQNYKQFNVYKHTEQFKNAINKEHAIVIKNELHQILTILLKYVFIGYSYIEKKNLRYDKNVCIICKNYSYLSFVKCTRCFKNYCLSHITDCCGVPFKFILRQPQPDRLHTVQALQQMGITQI